jgi:hypothetical protein
MDTEIDIYKVLDYLRDNSGKYAKAKADRIYLEEFRKSLKAKLMVKYQREGVSSVVAQERDAYADPEYETLLEGLKEAVEREEYLRWMLIAAQAKISVWQSLGANARAESKNV